MSRGTGTLQNRIVAELSAAGSWLFVADLAERIAPGAGRSTQVSIRRAVASLAKRGLVKRGEFRGNRRGAENLSAAVWLPNHDDPLQSGAERLVSISGKFFEDLILESLRARADAGEVDVEYSVIMNAVRKRLGFDPYEEPRVFTATARAVDRLEQRGVIEVERRRRLGRCRRQTLKLISVAQLEENVNEATLIHERGSAVCKGLPYGVEAAFKRCPEKMQSAVKIDSAE